MVLLGSRIFALLGRDPEIVENISGQPPVSRTTYQKEPSLPSEELSFMHSFLELSTQYEGVM